MEKQSFIKDKNLIRVPTKRPLNRQMHKKKLVIASLIVLLSIGLFVVAGIVFTPDSSQPDSVFSNTKIITLNITRQDNFERLINVDFSKVNDTRFLVTLTLNETLRADIQTCRALPLAQKLTCFQNIRQIYFADITLQDILDSLNSITSMPINDTLTGGLKVDKSSFDLSNGVSTFYVDLVDYNSADLTKSVGKRFKVGLHSITIETVESTNDVGQYSSIALDSNGFAHISYYDYTNGDLRYCNNTVGTWSCAAIDSTGNVGQYSSIAIDTNNKIHISHYDYNNKDLRYCNNTLGTWSCAAIDSTGDVGRYTSIAIDTNNKIHISEGNNINSDLRYCNNTLGTWSCTSIDSIGNIYDSSIAIDTNNKIHISYYDYTNGDLRYCNNTVGTWSCAAIDSTGNVGQYSSIAIDTNNKIHISHYDYYNKDLRYCNNTLGTWSCAAIDSTGDVGQYSSIAIDTNNKIHISYYDYTNGDLRYCNNIVGTWSCAAIDSTGNVGQYSSIAIKKGRLVDSTSFSPSYHISYYKNTDLIYLNGQIYALSLSILAPANQSWLNSNTSINLNFTILNETTLSQCIYNFNTTNISIANCQNTTFTTPNGNYLLNLWINDSAGSMVSNSTNFSIDTINPLISFTSTQDANNTNFSRNWIFLNTTSTEINFANITFRIANSTNITTAVYTSYTNVSNFTGRIDGVYTYNITLVDLASNSNTTETRTIRLDNLVPSISVFDPDPAVYASNISIPLNFTSSDAVVGLANSTYQVLNASGGAVIIANTTLTGNVTFNVSKEWTYNFTLWSTDLLNQIGRVDVQFSVDMTGPAVVLDTPVSNANLSNGTNVYLNFTATKTGGVSQCQLWGNFTGTWHQNYTWLSVTTAVQNYTTLNFSNSYNLWNVLCNDTSNNQRWALNNLTFLVDLTYPQVVIDSITTTASQTISFNSTQTDTYGTLNTCKYSIYDSTGAIDGANGNISLTCNSNPTSASVSAYATYKLRVYALDYAGNENSTNLSFTTSATAGGTVGGGGGGGAPPAEDTGFCGDNICKADRGETFQSCPEDCAQLNFNFDSFLFNCLDGKENDCFWERNTGLLFGVMFLIGFLLFSLLFKINPEKKGIKKIVYVKPKIFKKRR